MALLCESLYPAFGVNKLRSQRGQNWADLVDTLSRLPKTDSRVMAFTLTIRRLRRTQDLSHSMCRDPFCAICAAGILAEFKGEEWELLQLYYRHLDEIESTLKTMRVRQRVPLVGVAAA